MSNGAPVLWILVITLITGIARAEMDFPTWTQSDWRLEDDRAVLDRLTPDSLRTPVLILGERRRKPSEAVVILLDAPFESVRPVVADVWARRGYAVDKAPLPMADLGESWRRLMLAAQPDLRAVLVNEVYGPALAQAVKDGALTESERRHRLQRLAARVQAAPETLRRASTFRETMQRARYHRERRINADARQVDDYSVLDLRPIMGRPATAVTIQREHRLRRPQRLLSGLADTPQFLNQSLVPAGDFQATLQALQQALPDAALRLAASPEVWVPSVPMPKTRPAPNWRHPAQGPRIEPKVRSLRTTDALILRVVQPQPDGVLVVGVQREARLNGESVLIAQLWRLVPGAAAPKVLWQGLGGADDLHANASGTRFWFTGQPLNGAPTTLFQYRQGQGVTALDVSATDRQRLAFAQWWMDDEGPVIAAYSVLDLRRLEGSTLSPARRVPRQDWFPNGLRLLAGGDAPWVEDGQGVAELELNSGRVKRALPVPARRDALPGTSPWPGLDPSAMMVTSPGVVSAKGQWLATAFRFEKWEGKPLVGMHLLDTDKGELLYSAVLPDAVSVRLTAASNDGRWLAVYGGNGIVLLWDVRGDTAPSRLAVPGVALEDLVFSADGSHLYGVGNEHILTWRCDG